jgi:ribonuclease T2
MEAKQYPGIPRERRPGGLRAVLVAILLVAAPLAAQARHRFHDSAAGAFDYYLLSLSIAPSFCALSPANNARSECRNLAEADYRQMPLTVHGLWPNRAFASVNRQPQHCPGPPLPALPDDLQAQLGRVMPGGPGLERHEWSTHGTCSGLSPQTYFGALVRLARNANDTIGGVLRDNGLLGKNVRTADLLAGVAARDPALARATIVSCRFPRGGANNGRALIEEIRIVLSKDFAPLPAASVGLGQNSGCPQGGGFLPGQV